MFLVLPKKPKMSAGEVVIPWMIKFLEFLPFRQTDLPTVLSTNVHTCQLSMGLQWNCGFVC